LGNGVCNITSIWFSRYTEWRNELSWQHKFVLAFMFATLTGICAQIIIPLPWTPVPITLQTFAVLLTGVLMGRHWAGFSQMMYVGVGAAGFPWFSGFGGGIAHLTGATGGYLIGFIVAAWLVGNLWNSHRGFVPTIIIFTGATLLIYLCGLLQLYVWLSSFGETPTLFELLVKGAIPFVPGDIIKAIGVATCVWAFTGVKKSEN